MATTKTTLDLNFASGDVMTARGFARLLAYAAREQGAGAKGKIGTVIDMVVDAAVSLDIEDKEGPKHAKRWLETVAEQLENMQQFLED